LEKQFIISDDQNDDLSQVSRKLDIPKTIDMKIKSNLDDMLNIKRFKKNQNSEALHTQFDIINNKLETIRDEKELRLVKPLNSSGKIACCKIEDCGYRIENYIAKAFINRKDRSTAILGI